jgi:succinate dehydrogenase/fumarate reductase iron-sulfur protein
MEVLRDLVCDMTNFFDQYKSIKPWIVRAEKSSYQSPEERSKIEGSYECVMCAACSTNCPSYWWNEQSFVGPAAMVQSYRWLMDSRDVNKKGRLQSIKLHSGIGHCHSIFSCTQSCPKGLNPAQKIVDIKNMIS